MFGGVAGLLRFVISVVPLLAINTAKVLTLESADFAEVALCLSVSQELSFMDFPSSKCFCSVAEQIRPQHAWLETATAHPGQLQPAVRAALASLGSSPALAGAPGAAAGAARELPT